jgi:DNA ligase (NAD+)
MNKLHELLDRASEAYYQGTPTIPDYMFDMLAEGCGYNKVGAPAHGNKAKHVHRMYSLQKFYEDEGKSDPLAGLDVTTSIKLDGAAISLLYVDGVLVQALTRGDGVEGQLITDKMYEHGNLVPLRINLGNVTVQVTGEIVAPLHVENSRNYAAGSLNLKDLNEFKTRAIEFFAYQITPNLDPTWSGDMRVLKQLGFNTVLEPDLAKIYPSDGIVVRLNNNHQFEQLGYTSKHPRGAYARKERQAHIETILRKVEWNVAKTGRVTPVAIFDPINIDGKLISRATLNNPGFIEALDLRIGDIIAVRLAGMIIPEIIHKIDA